MIAGPRSGFQPRHLGFLSAVVSVAAVLMTPPAADATTIERIVSPGGIEAWLVQEPTVPLIALDFAFRGGADQDPVDKPGVASMATELLDEGAGEYRFQELPRAGRSQSDPARLQCEPRPYRGFAAHAVRQSG